MFLGWKTWRGRRSKSEICPWRYPAEPAKPFATWLELERTYHFVQAHAPELLGGTLREAREAALATTVEVAASVKRGIPTGSNQYRKADEESGNLPNSTQPVRASRNGIGERTQRKIDRLARDHPELHGRVCAGEISVNRAAVEAGIVRETVTVRVTIQSAPRTISRALVRRCTGAPGNHLR